MAAPSWLHGTGAMRLTEGLVSLLKEQRPEFLAEALSNYREHGVFSTQNTSDVAALVGFSNAKLSSSKTRFEGLCLLSMLVKDSSSDLFQQHCLSWLRSLQQVIQSQAPVQTIQLAVSILKDLLQYSCQLAELAREVSLNFILGILTSLLGLKTECELAAMEGMKACMIYYPRACGSLKDKLGVYFLSKMDSTNRKTQEVACQGYSHLPCLGGLLDKAVNVGRAEGWTNQIHCLLASANSLLAQIYQGSETDEAVQYQGPGMELAFAYLDQTDPLLLLQLQHRYTAVCMTIKHTLRADPASAVHLPVRLILNLVCRALAANSKSINLTADGSLRLLILPSVHISSLEVLSELITEVRSGMIQYAAVIQRLFSQTLTAWTPLPDTSVGQQRAYSSVRVSVYRTLELWVKVVGSCAGILQGASSHAGLLFNHLLLDITPEAESVKLRTGLSVDVVPAGKPGPRRTKQLVLAETVGPSLQRKGDLLSNQDTCLSALRALRHIIQTSGTLLKDEIHKRLHEVVLPLCVRLQQQQSSSVSACDPAGGISGQYSSALTRRELYRLLLALVLVPSPCWPPPLSCAVSILSNGRTERNLKVSTFCAEALTVCNSILHSRSPSIALPLPPLALKPTTTPSVLSCQGPGPGPRLTLPTLLGGPAPGPSFPTRHTLSMSTTTSLLGSLENHLSLIPGMPSQAPVPGDLMLSPQTHHQSDPVAPPEGQRSVFVRYDKEEAEDVEISLASDSDDSVVIVPPGMLNTENQQNDLATNSQNVLSSAPGSTGVSLPGGNSVSMVPTTAASTTVDVASLPNDLATSSSAPINSFPPSSTSVVSLVPSLNSSSFSAPPGGSLGDSGAGKPGLQQMLMQPSVAGQPGSVTLPLQMHQLQNQLTQQGRHLHQHPPAPTSNEESAVININSTDEEEDEEEDEEDLDDEEEMEDEEDGIDEEDEEEEGSDEFYDGEEYEEFEEEEGEELEEEEEEDEDGDIPPLEGSEDKSEEIGMEDDKVLQAAMEEEGEVESYSVEGEAGGGIEELQTSRTLFGGDRMKIQEVESIGVLEEAREAEQEEDESERMDDPTMPQILCVTGGAPEGRSESAEESGEGRGDLQEEVSLWEQGAKGEEVAPPCEEHTASQNQQEPAAENEEGSERDEQPSSHQEKEPAAAEGQDSAAGAEDTSADEKVEEQEQTDADQENITEAEPVTEEEMVAEEGKGDEEESDGKEEKGLKRKREDENTVDGDGQNTEKKKMEEEAMASMLADFNPCPPDEDDDGSGLNRSNTSPPEGM